MSYRQDIVRVLFIDAPCTSWGHPVIPSSKGTHSAAALNTRRWKLEIFDWNRRLSRKRYEIGPWLLWNVNMKSQWSIRVGSDDLEWPWKAGRQGQIFQVDLVKSARAVWLRTTNFGRVTRMGEGHRGSATPQPQGSGAPTRPNFFIC